MLILGRFISAYFRVFLARLILPVVHFGRVTYNFAINHAAVDSNAYFSRFFSSYFRVFLSQLILAVVYSVDYKWPCYLTSHSFRNNDIPKFIYRI